MKQCFVARDGEYAHWLQQAGRWLDEGRAFAVVTILSTLGSSPQKSATKMLVADDEVAGTVGGGMLEQRSIETARELLAAGEAQRVCVWTLSAAVGQCCGGRVAVLFERCSAVQPTVALFGVGHVGREVAAMLRRLPYRVLAFDTFPGAGEAAGVEAVADVGADAGDVAALPPECAVLIMTHSHDVDFMLCEAALRREDLRFVAVIGSAAKGARFRARLRRRGLDAARLVCPIGAGGVYPAEIAVNICAAVVGHFSPPRQGRRRRDGEAAALMQALAGGAA